MGNCLFCNEPKQTSKYKDSQKDIEHICAGCVQILLASEQLNLKLAYEKTLSKGYESKARAIESFLIPEDDSEQRKQRKPRRRSRRASGKTVDRKRVTRTFRR